MNAVTLNSHAPSEQPAALLTYLAAAKHRRPWLIATLAVAMLLTIFLALVLPPKFRSAATILIEQQEMPQDFVRSTVTSYADERVQIISKRVMTTETLLNIIKRYDLYPKERASDTREALLERMRKDIGLKMISADVIDPRSGHPTSATIAFEVSYTSVNPELAAKVASELTTAYLNENLNNRTQLARDATSFLESEGDRLNHRIGELEAQLAKFKDKHAQQLPELTTLNMQLLDHSNEELRSLDSRRASLEQQKVFLEAQLVQLKPNSVVISDTGERIVSTTDRLKQARSQLDTARAMYSPDHPDVIRLERQVAGLEKQLGPDRAAPTAAESNDLQRRLTAAKASLAEAEGRYGPEHPDRIRAQHEVQMLQAQIDAAPAPASVPKLVPKEADNPAYVQIQAQLSATINDLDSVQQQADKLRARSADLQKNLNMGPQVEQQYRELTRDYDNTKLKYMEIRSKQAEARTAQNLESDRKGERFTLIEPPLPPEQPVSPNRKLIFLAGMVLSVGLAAGVLWLLETIDTSVRGRVDLLKLTGVPPLALVPYIGTDEERARARRLRRFTVAGAFASVCVLIVLTHFYYEPLDVLWFSLSRRMGL